jgi:hypothetical protein
MAGLADGSGSVCPTLSRKALHAGLQSVFSQTRKQGEKIKQSELLAPTDSGLLRSDV